MNQHGDVTNNEPECYTLSNSGESGGVLSETVQLQSVNCPDGYGGFIASNYTSGAIQMKSFSFTYGRVDVRAKFAGGIGPWPAIWLLGADCQLPTWLSSTSCAWPNPGSDEIDIAEIMGSNLTQVNEQIHSSLGNPSCRPPVSDVSQNWHDYVLDWQPGSLTFQIDGISTCTLTGASVPSHPMFLILNNPSCYLTR